MGDTAADSGSQGDPLTLSAGMGWTVGRTGLDFAIGFDGTVGVEIPEGISLPSGGDPRFFSCWVSIDPTMGAVLIDQGTDGDGTRWILLCGGDGSILLILGPGQVLGAPPGTITDSTWHLITASYAAGNLELFLDGASQGTMSITLNTTPGPVFFGQAFDGSDVFPFGAQDWQFWPTDTP